MKDIKFLYWNDWWTNNYKIFKVINSRRYFTFKIALNLFLQYDGMNIVETGTQRMWNDPSGCSTYLFGSFCKYYNKKLYSIDNNINHIQFAKSITSEFVDYIEFIHSDSVEYLKKLNEPIDLLYLDSLDCNPIGDSSKAQEYQLNELISAYPYLHKNSIVLLDDNAFKNGGKTKLSKEYLFNSNEFILILDDIQSLWIKVI